MPAFHYHAVDSIGHEQKGVIEADNEKLARQLLRDKSLLPLEIKLAHKKQAKSQQKWLAFFHRTKNLNSKEIALFTRQFAMLLSAGLPVEAALGAVGEQLEQTHIKGLILSVRAKVLEGHALVYALREYPETFSPLYCATVAAGERSGYLDKVLLRLADYTEQQWHMRQKLRTALIYPVTVILVAMAIVGFLLEYVVPKMIAVYAHLDQTLPLLTQILIAISSFTKNWGLFFLTGIIISISFGWRALKRNLMFREKVHQFILPVPWIGNAAKIANTARFSRTLAILSAAGVPILEAMTIAAKLITIIPIQKAVEVAILRVREGAPIHRALKQTGFFSPMSTHMIASGETSGQLETMLERVAMNQEDDITRLIDVSLALFEPIMIVVMGLIVLFIVLAVLLPIFQLNQFTG